MCLMHEFRQARELHVQVTATHWKHQYKLGLISIPPTAHHPSCKTDRYILPSLHAVYSHPLSHSSNFELIHLKFTRRKMLGTIYETAGTIPATIKTRYRKTTTAVFEKVKALFKKTDTTLHESSTPDLNSTFLWIDAHTPYHHGESRLITLPPADEHTDGGLPGWLSARDEDQVHPPASSPHIITTAPSPAYARFCREREDRRAKFQACLDYGSVEEGGRSSRPYSDACIQSRIRPEGRDVHARPLCACRTVQRRRRDCPARASAGREREEDERR